VPVVAPFTIIEAPTTGDPSFESITLPVMVLLCAHSSCEARSRIGSANFLSRFLHDISNHLFLSKFFVHLFTGTMCKKNTIIEKFYLLKKNYFFSYNHKLLIINNLPSKK